ncbi:MAG: Hsp70 family protein [Clostridiales bacterium]|jgi:molecular chaperone DnaK|nr:Hsp70 family protein [Clostridiales bacterium]
MGVSVGIDLGTTFSAVAIIGQDGLPRIVENSEFEKTTPSVIQFRDGEIVFGSEAKEAFSAGDPNCAAFFKRNMGLYKPYGTFGGRSYTAEELSGMLLKHIKSSAESTLGSAIDEAVITVPAYFYSKEREATMEAARLAGLKVRKIINEPTAAVIAYGLNNWRVNANILVYDLGGGTFDVTLVRMEENQVLQTLATTGNRFLGGVDWDERIESLLVEKILESTRFDASESERFKHLLKGSAEGLKKQMSQKSSSRLTIRIPEYGKVTSEISKAEFDQATVDLLEMTGIMCATVLKSAGASWKDVSDTLLVGGSTRMPQVREYLQKLSGKPPIAHVNPDEAVALGAAVQTILADTECVDGPGARIESRLIKPVGASKKISAKSVPNIKLNEVTTHPMGVIAINPEGTMYINELIIPANHQIPTRQARSFKYATSAYGSNELEIYVLQGDRKPLDCVIPYKYVATGIKHGATPETTIRIQYSYDQNGIIHVQARQGDSKTDLPIRKEPVPEDMSMYGKPIEKRPPAPEPLSIMLAIDTSGSMYGAPMQEAKMAMASFVNQFKSRMLDGTARIGILAFTYGPETVLRLTSDPAQCLSAIETIERYGRSGIHPLDGIKSELREAPGRKCSIVLTDGEWSDGGTAIPAAKNCHEAGIEIAAIGFGYFDRAFLQAISSSDANAFLVSRGELESAFGTIAQSLGTQSSPKAGEKSRDTQNSEVWDID